MKLEIENYARAAFNAGCPKDQLIHFVDAKIALQPRQLAASAAARSCDEPGGPIALGYGGARGGGKSHWLLAQMGADDCQRFPGLKCLLLRKVGKANAENLEDLRHRIFNFLPHEFSSHKGILTFANGSRIIAGHFQNESDIDNYLGLEYDVIGIEEATTLTRRKYVDISTCSRSSKRGWRPRIYSTTNPGGVGHSWYKAMFIDEPRNSAGESNLRRTVFIPARVEDNEFNNVEYRDVLDSLTGWQKRAWREGDWDISAGQYFTNFRREIHVLDDVDEILAREWFAALDYGFTHYTVCLLGFKDGDGNVFIVDEHAERQWLPHRHAAAIEGMIARHRIASRSAARFVPRGGPIGPRPLALSDLRQFVAGADVFGRQWDGATIAQQYAELGIELTCANMDRVNGWAEILRRFGHPGEVVRPSLFIHKRCARLIDCLPNLRHDPNRPEDVLKVDCDEDGMGGDDTADALRYLVNTSEHRIIERNLTGFY